MIYYTISGKPVPLARPRLGKSHTYDSQVKLKEKAAMELLCQRTPGVLPTKRPVQLVVTFNMPLPKITPKYKQQEMIGKPCTKRNGDIDNLCKYLLDVCNGLLIMDDSQVSSIHAKKVWAFEGSTEFNFIEIL